MTHHTRIVFGLILGFLVWPNAARADVPAICNRFETQWASALRSKNDAMIIAAKQRVSGVKAVCPMLAARTAVWKPKSNKTVRVTLATNNLNVYRTKSNQVKSPSVKISATLIHKIIGNLAVNVKECWAIANFDSGIFIYIYATKDAKDKIIYTYSISKNGKIVNEITKNVDLYLNLHRSRVGIGNKPNFYVHKIAIDNFASFPDGESGSEYDKVMIEFMNLNFDIFWRGELSGYKSAMGLIFECSNKL
jgi:type II secretory pathway pseudopilin PulG